MEDPNAQQLPHCSYQYLSNGIHEFVLEDGSRAAFDDFLTLFQVVHERQPADTLITHLLDMHQGMPPMTYTFNRLKKYIDEMGVRRTTRVALIHDPSTDISMAQSFSQMLRIQGTLQFFTDRQQAMAWLLDVTV